jgi:hypothetical protein
LKLSPSTESLPGRVLGFFEEKKTLCVIADRLALGEDRSALGTDRPEACRGGVAPAPDRGPSKPVPRTVRASAESTAKWSVPVFGVGANTLFGDSAGDKGV